MQDKQDVPFIAPSTSAVKAIGNGGCLRHSGTFDATCCSTFTPILLSEQIPSWPLLSDQISLVTEMLPFVFVGGENIATLEQRAGNVA